MSCIQTEYENRRVIYALRPTPIRQGIKSPPKAAPYRLFGISERVYFIAAGLAAISWALQLIQGI